MKTSLKYMLITLSLGVLSLSLWKGLPSKNESLEITKAKFQKNMKSLVKLSKTFNFTDKIIEKAHAASTLADQFANDVRFFYFMIAGWPGVTENGTSLTITDETVYRSMNSCADGTAIGDCDGPPIAGMLSLYNQIMLGYQDSTWTGIGGILASANSDYASCDGLPTTSTPVTIASSLLSSGQSLSLTAGPGQVVIPTGHTSANGSLAYSKRIEFTFGESASSTHRFIVEMNCSTTAQLSNGQIQLYMAMNFSEQGVNNRIIEFYVDKMDLDAQKYEFFMNYVSSSQPQYMALNMNINQTANTTNYNMLMGNGGSNYNGYRVVVNGNTSDDDFTVGFQSIASKSSWAQVAAGSNATSSAVTQDYSGGQPNEGEFIVFCLDGNGSGTYTGTDDSVLGNAGGNPCTSLSLSALTTAPAIDSSGSWSLNWATDETNGLPANIWNGTL